MLKNYFLVTKPWIVAANLVAAAGVFFLAAQGRFAPELFLCVMAGLCCVVASGCVLNNYIDRDIDRRMARTCGRVLATDSISLQGSLAYAAVLGLAGAALLLAGTNGLTLAVALCGFAVYVGAYSLYLKRNSVHSTVLGSLAGAAPPLAAYCAVRNSFDLGALIVLAMFSLWQVPHSYAITIFRRDDYAAAGLPVMSVRAGIAATKRHIVWHVAAFVVAAQMLTAFGYAGYAYLVAATGLGLCWLGMALSGFRARDDRRWARRLYRFSILTIFALSLMMSVDFARGPF
ncbi:Protoheme IX farnesyltransferase [Desulfovibrio sp. X2]|uniref:heme o synthase n=1 Tax=Desulfovibrio sp. X2 TaxID=941449 RepID=UPI000358E8F4|nr:heme o synthase [Desulfovibrio sp. X2]EPR41176.1 Protoheme IX farnesyltransferase [Desulfovibrio sp. X2]